MRMNHSVPSLSYALRAVVKREWLLQWRQSAEWLNPLCFLMMVVVLFPLGVSPEKSLLRMIAPGIIWIAVLLSSLLAVDNLFKQDYEDGSLDQWLVAPQPLFLLLYAKLLVHGLLLALPVILLTPIWAGMLFLSGIPVKILCLTLLLGLPAMTLMSALGAALTVGLRRGGVLIVLLVLPFNIPMLIFSTSAVQAALQGLPAQGYLAILGALSLLAITFVPWVVASALRIMTSR